MGEQVQLPGTPAEDRPGDLLDYNEAAKQFDRSRNTIRWWVRSGQLRSWLDGEGNHQKRLVSRADLQSLVVQSGKMAAPGGPGRGTPEEATSAPPVGAVPASDPDMALRLEVERLKGEAAGLRGELSGARGELAAVRMALETERARVAAVQERAEVERLRAAEWQDRAEALTAEVGALRGAVGLPWWRRLLG